MKKIMILIVFLIGLAAYSCSSPPDSTPTSTSLSGRKVHGEFVQVADLQVSVPVMNVADEATLPVPDTPANGITDFLKNNAAALTLALMGFLKVIVNLTPTEKDNKVFGLLDTFINWIVPNFKSGGGTHT